jgi:hypothetical protein
MSDVVWETTYSLDSKSSLQFAWAYMTNVANWDDPPAKFELAGPFTAGSCGTTWMPGQEPRHWRIAEVNQLKSYVLETELQGAAMSFEWRFDGIAGGTRLTQRIVLKGENAAPYVEEVEVAFGLNLAVGMNKIVSAIERAEASGRLGSTTPASNDV